MPKWVSKTSGGDGTHLYPHSSIEDEREYSDPKSHALKKGKAVGPAYCGADGAGESVFRPNNPTDAIDGFTGVLEWRGGSWINPCEECRELIESGKLIDPEWHRRFRASVAGEADA